MCGDEEVEGRLSEKEEVLGYFFHRKKCLGNINMGKKSFLKGTVDTIENPRESSRLHEFSLRHQCDRELMMCFFLLHGSEFSFFTHPVVRIGRSRDRKSEEEDEKPSNSHIYEKNAIECIDDQAGIIDSEIREHKEHIHPLIGATIDESEILSSSYFLSGGDISMDIGLEESMHLS